MKKPFLAKILSHRADLTNMLRAIFAPILFFLPFGAEFLAEHEIWYFIILSALIGDINYVLHLHIHRPFTQFRHLNVLLDLCLGAVTGVTASNWRIQHLYGHHAGNDHPFRAQSRGELARYTIRNAISFSMRSILPSFIGPIVKSFKEGVLASKKTPIDYRWAFVEQCLSITLVAALCAWQTVLTCTYLVPWYALNYLIARYVDYLNHYGCDENSPNLFERSNNSVSQSFNWLTNNFGHHTAHHLKPNAHWTELPEIHRIIVSKIPGHCLKSFSWSIAMVPYHFYLSTRRQM
jgi:fatty acid desaturase